MSKFAVGDTVFVEFQESVIEKVGRKWVHVRGYPNPFDRDTGRERVSYGAPKMLLTAAERALTMARMAAISKLSKAGISIAHGRRHEFSLDTLMTIVEVVEKGKR